MKDAVGNVLVERSCDRRCRGKTFLGIATVVVFQVLLTHWPMVHLFFHTAPLDSGMRTRIRAAAVSLLLVVEAQKAIVKRLVCRAA